MNAFTGPRDGYGYGFGASYEYKSSLTIGGLPLLHVCGGVDPRTLRPRIAKGVIAIGNIALGIVAVGGIACGLFSVGGASFGLLVAVGGAALSLGVSVGGFAAGTIAIGGVAIGALYAIGGVAIAPAVLDSTRCDAALLEAVGRWVNPRSLPPNCR
jgi:hypothetical protein